MESNISFTLRIWRQAGPKEKGGFKEYHMSDIPTDTSFLEMLDILNEQLIEKVRNLSCLTTIAVKVSAECVLFT